MPMGARRWHQRGAVVCFDAHTGVHREAAVLIAQHFFCLSVALARHFLKPAIDHTDVEVHMPIQAGAEAVDESDCANVQGRLVHLGRTGAVVLQALHYDPQEDAQHHAQYRPVTLHEVAQPLRDGEHPLAHRQAPKAVS